MLSACRFFSFLVSGGRGDGVSSRSSSRSSSRGGVLFRGGVPLLVSSFVSCWRPVYVSWVSVLVLAFRLSCRRWRLASRPASRLVLSSRVVWRFVSALSCCAVFVSSCSRVVSSFSCCCCCFFSCSSRRACRMMLRRSGWAIRNCRCEGRSVV